MFREGDAQSFLRGLLWNYALVECGISVLRTYSEFAEHGLALPLWSKPLCSISPHVEVIPQSGLRACNLLQPTGFLESRV